MEAKRIICELRPCLQSSARAIQQLAAAAETQISTMFGAVPMPIEEATITKLVEETDSLIQGWQQAVLDFTELRATTFRRVPELGPLFEQPLGGAQQEWAQDEGTQAEQGTGSSREMEVETVIFDLLEDESSNCGRGLLGPLF